MKGESEPLDRATATEYASWFKALADATRIQIVSLLARHGTPMTVGQIVQAVDVGQSTVSAHLKVLADVRFVLAEQRATARFYRINDACVRCFPTAADKPRVLAEAYRILRPGGRFGVTDIIADDQLDPEQRTAAEQAIGCAVGTLTIGGYRDQLLATGFTTATITPTHQVGPSLHSAIVQAGKPAAPRGVTIRPMRAGDAEEVLAIYQAGLDDGNASFETSAPTWEAFDAAKSPLHRHLATDTATGRPLGWVAASAVSDRCVYAGVVEHSVYVHPDAHGRGVGSALLQALISSTETAGIWTLQSGVFPENTASLALHARAGFRVIGTRERIGRHHGTWRDVVLLERRSQSVM